MKIANEEAWKESKKKRKRKKRGRDWGNSFLYVVNKVREEHL